MVSSAAGGPFSALDQPADVPADRQYPGGRVRPAYVAGEKAMYEAWLDFHRDTLLWKCSGLTAEQLCARAVPPSVLSLIGLVRHMTDVEIGWFGGFGESPGIEPVYYTEVEPDNDFDGIHPEDVEENVASYRDTIRQVRERTRTADLDGISHLDDGRDIGVRWIYAHMLEEYARHNGHADLLREVIDGATGD